MTSQCVKNPGVQFFCLLSMRILHLPVSSVRNRLVRRNRHVESGGLDQYEKVSDVSTNSNDKKEIRMIEEEISSHGPGFTNAK